ncbi:MAG: WbqC family protein [Tyzzerella sp.]|nr:WbqC family protein [Tyzzerella sp.]
MIISIHQPDYIPYLGYFYKIACSDKFIFLDNVQFSSSNMHHWNKILLNDKETRLKIPLDYHFGDNLTEVRCKYELGWVKKHLLLIQDAYSEAPYFEQVYPEIEKKLNTQYSSLAELNIALNTHIARRMGLETEFILASSMKMNEKKENLVIDLCKQLNGTCYISGNGARNYQSEEHFLARGIELKYTDFEPEKYCQNSEKFVPNLSVIDYLMNCGWNNPFRMNDI